MRGENLWLVIALEVAGWLTLLVAIAATFVVGPQMLALVPSWLTLVCLARLLAGQQRHANRLERAIARIRPEPGVAAQDVERAGSRDEGGQQ